MSGPLARSAHMRMKMKRDKGSNSSNPSTPRSPGNFSTPYPSSPTNDPVVATLSTASPGRMRVPSLNQQRQQQQQPPPSPSGPPSINRSNARRPFGGGINSLQTSDDYVVDDPVQAASSSRGGRRDGSVGAQQMAYEHPDQHQQQYQQPRQPAMYPPQTNTSVPIEDAAGYRGNYMLNPRQIRLASRPRRGYDSFVGQPSMSSEDGVVLQNQNQRQQQQGRSAQYAQNQYHQQQQPTQHQQDDEAFDPFAPSPLTIPNSASQNMRASPMFQDDAGFQSQQQYPVQAYNEGSVQQQFRGYQSEVMVDEYGKEYDGGNYTNHDGSEMVTIEGNDFVYAEDSYQYERDDAMKEDHQVSYVEEDKDFEYHTDMDEYGESGDVVQPLNNGDAYNQQGDEYYEEDAIARNNEEQTIDSERALSGTPIRKKERSKKSKNSKSGFSKGQVIIHNVGIHDSIEKVDGSSGRGVNPRYAIHYSGSQEEDTVDHSEQVVVPSMRGHSHKYNEIVATARRFANDSMDEWNTEQDANPGTPSRNDPYVLHGRVQNEDLRQHQLGEQHRNKKATNQVETDDDGFLNTRKVVLPQRIGASSSWDNTSNGDGRRITSSKSWDAPQAEIVGDVSIHKKQRNVWNVDDYEGGTMHHQFIGASKSWDQENAANVFKDDTADETALAEWDKAEAEWREKVVAKNDEVSNANKSDELPENKAKNLPWKNNGTGAIPMQSMQFDTDVNQDLSDYDDDDSIFAFEKQEKAKVPPIETDPVDIFQKISQGLKQADQTKHRALGIESDSEDIEQHQHEVDTRGISPVAAVGVVGAAATAAVVYAVDKSNKNVAFAGEKENIIHTYLVPEVSNSASTGERGMPSTSESDDYDDYGDEEEEEDEEDMQDTRKSQVKATARSSSQHNNEPLSGDGSVSRKKMKDGAVSSFVCSLINTLCSLLITDGRRVFHYQLPTEERREILTS